jgi:large subunit ribosomal protein L21
MYAVIETGGKQYRVAQGDHIRLEKVPGKKGDSVVFDKILLTSDGENVQVGKPYLEHARVVGLLKGEGKEKKIIVFKFKHRKGYRKTRGHRQHYSLIQINSIES